MSGGAAGTTRARIWRDALLVGVALGVLLAATAVGAFIPLGPFQTAFALLIAAAKVALVAVFYMELDRSPALLRLAASVGLIWFGLMFALTLSDFLTRGG